ncbi:MAG TPA: hypothetical protein DF383_12580, partial [Deltaproteobacteria bacterium]|nr:hypothetical protein [Deltaproteobacteria bacterium]
MSRVTHRVDAWIKNTRLFMKLGRRSGPGRLNGGISSEASSRFTQSPRSFFSKIFSVAAPRFWADRSRLSVKSYGVEQVKAPSGLVSGLRNLLGVAEGLAAPMMVVLVMMGALSRVGRWWQGLVRSWKFDGRELPVVPLHDPRINDWARLSEIEESAILPHDPRVAAISEILAKRSQDLQMEHIRAGKFEMGLGYEKEEVFVSDFFMDPYLVTVEKFQSYRDTYRKTPEALFLTMEDGQSFVIALGKKSKKPGKLKDV